MARLVVESSREKREVPLPKDVPVIVGRTQEVALAFEDGKLSREHCKFLFDGRDFLLEDLDSKNGTYVNNRRIKGKVGLHPGDEIRAGGVVLRFLLDPGDPQPIASDSVDDRVAFAKDPGAPPTARRTAVAGPGAAARLLGWIVLLGVVAGGAYGMKLVFVWALKEVAP